MAINSKPAVVDDTCPVCKQSTYLNPKMKFKINGICYHRICTSCVDRIYASGRAPCPIAGCKSKNATSRDFRFQTFADLQIERECDVRKQVNEALNRREEDFETLRAFNDYQEEKEELVWALMNKEEAAREKLKKYKVANKDAIIENKRRDEEEKFLLAQQKEALRTRSKQQQQEWEEDIAATKAARNSQSKGTIASIVKADDPERAARLAQVKAVQQKDEIQRDPGPAVEMKQEATDASGFSFAGLRKKVKAEELPPYDPFAGVNIVAERYKVRDDCKYQSTWLEQASENKLMAAGGFSTSTYITRALFEAHSGLGVILSKERAESVT